MPVPKRRFLATVLGLAAILTLSLSGMLSPRPAPRYTVTDLGVLPGHTISSAEAVNSRGDVVGSAILPGSDSGRATLYRGGRMTDLGVPPGGSDSNARGINSAGDVAGVASLPTGDHAFLYSGGRMRDLGTLPGFHDSAGVGLNDQGEIVVNAMSSPMQPGPPQIQAFFYSHGRMTALRMPSGCSESHARGINASGQIVGECRLASGGTHPFLYESRTGTMTMLTVPALYLRGWVSHVNDSGQVIGDVSLPDGSCHATIWRGNQMTDLGTPSGYPVSIGIGLNNRSEAVGNCFTDADSLKGFLLMHMGATIPCGTIWTATRNTPSCTGAARCRI